MKTVVCIALTCLLAGCRKEPPARASSEARTPKESTKTNEVVLDEQAQRNAGIVVQSAGTVSVAETILATGQITYNEDRTWGVGAVVEGRVVGVLAKAGDRVQKGQSLAYLHTHEVHDSRASYRKAAAEVARLESQLVQAVRVRDRARRLLELKALSREQLEHAEMDVRGAQSSIEKAKAELEKERIHLVEFLDVPVEESVSPIAGQDFVPVKSPAAGIVVERPANVGSVMSIGGLMFRVADVSNVWMIANVSESDLAHLRPGQMVQVTVRAYPDRKFSGRIVRLGEELDSATRTLKVRVQIPNEHGFLKPEMFANAEIERAASRRSLLVPDGAIQEFHGHKIVFVRVASDRFVVRPVQTGRSASGHIEVVDGLSPTEPVVVNGGFLLKSQLLRKSLEEE